MNVGEQADLAKSRASARDPYQVFHTMPPPFPFKVPRLFRHQAKEFAGTFYEGSQTFSAPTIKKDPAGVSLDFTAERSAMFRRQFPTAKLFVAWMWPQFVKTARQISIEMLRPDSNVSDHMREEIYEAVTAPYDSEIFEADWGSLNDFIVSNWAKRKK